MCKKNWRTLHCRHNRCRCCRRCHHCHQHRLCHRCCRHLIIYLHDYDNPLLPPMPLYRLHPQPRQSVVVADAASSSASTTTTIRRCRRCRFIVYIHDYNNLLLPPTPLHRLHPRLQQSVAADDAASSSTSTTTTICSYCHCRHHRYHLLPAATVATVAALKPLLLPIEPGLCLLNIDSSSVGGESPAITFTAADFSVCR